MSEYLLIIAVLFPIIFSIFIPLINFKSRVQMEIYTEAVVIITSVMALLLVIFRPEHGLVLISFTEKIRFVLKIDGMSMVFATLISILWPIATLYSFEYMSHEERERPFFMFYTMTFGVTLGISFAANLVTMYFFYEMLTLVTIPLVIHSFSREAVLATRKYIYYMMAGAALGFMGVVFSIVYGAGNFSMGGMLSASAGEVMGQNLMLFIFVCAFLGFSMKAAMFPFYAWIPDAGVAPTPVTALLHAVAVVKAGAFAVIRLTYYTFGVDLVKGTWAQTVVMSLAAFTIVFGCSMAVKDTHMKRRLAFSTVANLSYVIFGATIMTPAGLVGALSHMVFHAIMKISGFFCVGAIMHQTHKSYVHETDGFAKKMPWVYFAFLVSSLGMMGVPGTCGFISKWYLAEAALSSGNKIAYVGVVCLLISALLTAIYMMSMTVRGYFPERSLPQEKLEALEKVKDPSWQMILPLMLFTIAIIGFGFFSQPLITFLTRVTVGI